MNIYAMRTLLIILALVGAFWWKLDKKKPVERQKKIPNPKHLINRRDLTTDQIKRTRELQRKALKAAKEARKAEMIARKLKQIN